MWAQIGPVYNQVLVLLDSKIDHLFFPKSDCYICKKFHGFINFARLKCP